jgi:ATP-binding cassette subfamily B protein
VSSPAPRASIDPDSSKSWLRRALPIARAHWGAFVVALTLSAAGLVLQVQIPLLLSKAIDNSIITHRVPLSYYVYWTLGLAIAAVVSGFGSRLAMFHNAYGIEYDLRALMYEHLSRLGFSFYDRVQSGQLISRSNSDVRSVNLYLTFAPMILVQCAVAVVAFGYMLSIDVPLAFIAMATMPLVYLASARMRRSLFPVSWLIQSRLAEVATIVDENVNGVRIVKSFAAEDEQLRALARAATRLRWSYVKDADLRAAFTPAVQNLPQLGLVLVLFFGGWMVISGSLAIGSIVAFNSYLMMMQVPFTMLGMLIMMGQRAKASAQRIYEVLDEPSDIVDRPGAVELSSFAGDVRFEDVNFAYPGAPDHLVLAGVNLHVRPGETVAVVGRTGSGKSTLARLLARFYDVDAGAVRLDGHDVRDLSLASLRTCVGLVLDEPFLFSTSIFDNIAYARPDATPEEVRAAAEIAGAAGFIDRLPDAYETVVGERGYTLSGGQRQRIAIARALLADPWVLVLDDATSAIDVHVEQAIHRALIQSSAHRTLILIAHRLSTISLAERVVLLDEGRIVADGTHAELLEGNPLYAAVLAQGEYASSEVEPDEEGEPAL